MRLLFVFVFLSSVAFGQKTIKKIEKLNMGDAISPFTKNKHSIDERLDKLIYQNKLWPKSAYILNVINVDLKECDGVCISFYNPEVLFFYKKKKKFTGQLKVNTKTHFWQHTIISFLDGKLNGLFYDSISDGGDPVYVRKGNYENGYKNGKWTKWIFYLVDNFESDNLGIDNVRIEEQNWKKSKLEGLQKSWYPDINVLPIANEIKYGQLGYEGNYKDGKKDGLQRGWHENGQLEMEKNFKDGMNISSKYWDKDGNLLSKKCWDKDGNEIECD